MFHFSFHQWRCGGGVATSIHSMNTLHYFSMCVKKCCGEQMKCAKSRKTLLSNTACRWLYSLYSWLLVVVVRLSSPHAKKSCVQYGTRERVTPLSKTQITDWNPPTLCVFYCQQLIGIGWMERKQGWAHQKAKKLFFILFLFHIQSILFSLMWSSCCRLKAKLANWHS